MIGDRVKAYRDAAGMTQAEVVRLMRSRHGAQWHPQTLLKVEKGDRHLRLNEAAALAEVLGVTLDTLAYGQGGEPSKDDWRELAKRMDKALWHIQRAVDEAVAGAAS